MKNINSTTLFLLYSHMDCKAKWEEIIAQDSQLSLVGCSQSTDNVLSSINQCKPKIILMQNNIKNSLQLIQTIMQTKPIPVIVFTDKPSTQAQEAFQMINAGALEIVPIPQNEKEIQSICDLIKTIAEVKIVTRHYVKNTEVILSKPSSSKKHSTTIQAVGIGASLGGPAALSTIFASLSPNFRAPIFVVQHIASGFSKGLLNWLKSSSSLPIRLAENGLIAKPGTIYIAPDRFQMLVLKDNIIVLQPAQTDQELCPCVATLFQSLAKTYGNHCVGVILTGMGNDGAKELLLMRQKGAPTIAQDSTTSVMFGMPNAAIELGAAEYILPITQIAPTLESLVT